MKLFAAYLVQIMLAFDSLINALIPPLTGTLSYSGETLSARCYRAWRDKRRWGLILRPVINSIFFWQIDHCHSAYLKTLARLNLPSEYSTPPASK